MNRYEFLGRLGRERSTVLQPMDLETVLNGGEVTDVVDAVESHGRVARRRRIELDGYTRAVWVLADTDGELLYRMGYPQHRLSELIQDGLVAISYWDEGRESMLGATKFDVERERILESFPGPDGRREYLVNPVSGEFERIDS